MASPFVVRQYVPCPKTASRCVREEDRGEGARLVGLAMPSVSRLAIAVLGLALGLPFWRWPRAVAAFLTLPGDHALPRIQDGRAVIPAQLRTLVASRKRMGRIRPALYRPRPGRAYAGRDGRSRPCHAGPSDHALRAGLARAPGAAPRLDPLGLCRAARRWNVRKRPPPAWRWRAPLHPRAWPTVPPARAVPLFLGRSSRSPARLRRAPRSTSLAPRSKAPPCTPPNHRPRQLVESTMTADLEPPVKPRYAQPADD
jgi:hypothetical protein